EYAKAGPEDLCVRIEAFNRGPEAAGLHILPHLWFRNTWAWGPEPLPQPRIVPGPGGEAYVSLLADDAGTEPLPNLPVEYRLGRRYLYGQAGCRPLFTNNETNWARWQGGAAPNASPYTKDAFHRFVLGGEDCLIPNGPGTKACLHYG